MGIANRVDMCGCQQSPSVPPSHGETILCGVKHCAIESRVNRGGGGPSQLYSEAGDEPSPPLQESSLCGCVEWNPKPLVTVNCRLWPRFFAVFDGLEGGRGTITGFPVGSLRCDDHRPVEGRNSSALQLHGHGLVAAPCHLPEGDDGRFLARCRLAQQECFGKTTHRKQRGTRKNPLCCCLADEENKTTVSCCGTKPGAFVGENWTRMSGREVMLG